MFDDFYVQNQCIANPGLAIHGASSALVKYANTFSFKANGRISANITTADAPALSKATYLSPTVNGNSGGSPAITSNQLTYGAIAGTAVGSLAADTASGGTSTINSCQVYTLCADMAQTQAGTVSFYWLAGPAFSQVNVLNTYYIAHTPLSTSVEVGYVFVVNASAGAFVPGTTNLDTSGLTVTYINNFGIDGN